MKKVNSHNLKKYILSLPIIVLIYIQLACRPFVNTGKSSQSSLVQNNKKVLAQEFSSKSVSDMEKQKIYELLKTEDFESIEKIANEARERKERLAGGYWKLDSVYEALANIYADYPGQEVTDGMWKHRIDILRSWKEKSPASITARIALAKAYIEYGWFARGDDYINTVSNENYDLLQERLNMAQAELLEADKLKNKCPRWYREILFLEMAKGAPLEEFNRIYQDAVKFEPNYLQFYLVKSESMTPKWNGSQKDWQKFVDELPNELSALGTGEADLIYFVVVVNKLREQSLKINPDLLSKERIIKGFADMDKKYGVDNLRLNQFAFLTCFVQEYSYAKEAFDRIGEDWNRNVWTRQESFAQMKRIAGQKSENTQNK